MCLILREVCAYAPMHEPMAIMSDIPSIVSHARAKTLSCTMQEASVTHYRAFIEVAKGLGTTQEDLQHADSQLDALLADLPALSAACEQFAKSTAAFTGRRAESKQLLSKASPTPEVVTRSQQDYDDP